MYRIIVHIYTTTRLTVKRVDGLPLFLKTRRKTKLKLIYLISISCSSNNNISYYDWND